MSVFSELKAPPTLPPKIICNKLSLLYRNSIILIPYMSSEKFLIYDLDKQNITNQFLCDPTYTTIDLIFDHCMDRENNVLYIVIGDKMVSIDLTKNEWNIMESENVSNLQSFYYVSSINKLYINRFNKNRNNLEKNLVWSSVNSMLRNDDQYFYRDSTDQLFKKRWDGEISYCNIDTKVKSVSNWKIYPMKLPKHHSISSNIILAFDQIIFYFDFPSSDNYAYQGLLMNDDKIYNEWRMWCLDLDHNEKWYEVHDDIGDNIVKKYVVPSVITDEDNNLHLIHFDEEKEKRYHFRASLFHLIPREIKEMNRSRFDALIVGYIKEFETEENKTVTIPMYLRKLITKFYTHFI